MTQGFPTTKADIDSRVGVVAMNLRDVFNDVKNLQAWLATQTSQNLIDRGYVQGEVDTIKSAYTDLDKLRTIYEGTATQSSTYDFRTFAKLLIGVM